MTANCKTISTIIGLVIVVFALWDVTIFSWLTSQVIIVIAGALIVIHALSCKKCNIDAAPMKKAKKKKR